MGKDRYLVAFTTDTLLLGDLVSCKLSEVSKPVLLNCWYMIYCHVFVGCVVHVRRQREVLF